MLLLTVLIVNPIGAVILGCITPIMALIRGQLPSVLAPAVPFIMIGNALLVLIFAFLLKRIQFQKNNFVLIRYGLALFFAAFIKFIWLALAARLILPIIIGLQIPRKFITVMTFPQLITAIAGGIFAFCLYELLVRAGIVNPDSEQIEHKTEFYI
jgi:ABC-type Co2+ transport system permease subunit